MRKSKKYLFKIKNATVVHSINTLYFFQCVLRSTALALTCNIQMSFPIFCHLGGRPLVPVFASYVTNSPIFCRFELTRTQASLSRRRGKSTPFDAARWPTATKSKVKKCSVIGHIFPTTEHKHHTQSLSFSFSVFIICNNSTQRFASFSGRD